MKTQIKKLLSILTLIAILATAFYTVPVTSSAEEWAGDGCYRSSDKNWVYRYNGHLDIALVEYNGNETEVIVPETVDGYSVTGIGNFNDDSDDIATVRNFFKDGTNITKVTLPKTIKEIGCYYEYSRGSDWDGWEDEEYLEDRGICYSNLDSNRSVVEFSIDEENPYFTSEDGVIYNKDKTKLIMYPAGKTDEVFTIPETVTEIGDFAFANAQVKRIENLDNINEIPMGLFMRSNIEEFPEFTKMKKIEDYAFAYCNKLKKITIHSKVDIVGCYAFYSCKGATEIDFGKINYIDYAAFAQCSALKEAVLPTTCDVIGRFAFSNCKNLEKVTMPKVDSIGYRSFYKCINLTTINYNHTHAEFLEYLDAYYNDEEYEGFYEGSVKKNVIRADEINYQAFMGCTSLKKIDVLDAKTIKNDAFDNTALVNNQKDGVVYIDDVALCYKAPEKAATTIKIKEGTKHIAEGCLYEIDGVKQIYIPSSVEFIDRYNIDECKDLKRVYIAGKKTEIAKYSCDNIYQNENIKYYILPKAYKVLDYFDNGDYNYTTNWNPDKTKSVNAVGKTKSTAKITWKKQGYVSGYEVFMKTSKNGSWKKVATLKGSDSTSYTKKGLSKNKTYYFRVRAYKDVDAYTFYGAFSSSDAAKTKSK